jgi:hypothetical protein
VTRTDRLLLAVLAAVGLVLPVLQRAATPRPVRAEAATWRPLPTATHWYRSPTPRPPEPTATVFCMPITVVWRSPTPPATPRWTPYIALSEGMTEQEAIEWLEGKGQ